MLISSKLIVLIGRMQVDPCMLCNPVCGATRSEIINLVIIQIEIRIKKSAMPVQGKLTVNAHGTY